ncbi:MAG: hypothetical protein M1467_06245 [Deltaproteobacteria bacterium]|nr:hypothetical protein [Deltaproteobacteria bacterium]
MEQIKKGDDYMNMSLSVSPEKYFDSRFDGQEKLFTEKFNGLKTQFDERFNSLENKFDERFNSLEIKIDAIDKRSKWSTNLTFGVLGLLAAMVGTLLVMTSLHHF